MSNKIKNWFVRFGCWMYEMEAYKMHFKGQVNDHTLNAMIRWSSFKKYKSRKKSYGH